MLCMSSWYGWRSVFKKMFSSSCNPGNVLTIDLTVGLQQIWEPAPRASFLEASWLKAKAVTFSCHLADRTQHIPHGQPSCDLSTCLPMGLKAGLLLDILGPGITLGL